MIPYLWFKARSHGNEVKYPWARMAGISMVVVTDEYPWQSYVLFHGHFTPSLLAVTTDQG